MRAAFCRRFGRGYFLQPFTGSALLAVAHESSPYLTIYDATDYSKLSDPATLPNGAGRGVAFNPGASIVSVTNAGSPYVSNYNVADRSKLPNPPMLPTGTATGVRYTYAGDFLAVGAWSTFKLSVYNTGTWARTGPTPQPAGNGHAVAFNSADSILAVGVSFGTPIVVFYETGTWAALGAPAVMPPGSSIDEIKGVAFSPTPGIFVAVGTANPRITVYDTNGDDLDTSTWVKQADPASLPAGTANGVAFNHDGSLLAVAHTTTPFITIYDTNGGDPDTSNWVKLSNPATLPAGAANGVAFNADGSQLAVAHNNSPYITIYDTNTWIKIADPAVLPAGNATAVAYGG